MPKKKSPKDSTTDFFLDFISKEKGNSSSNNNKPNDDKPGKISKALSLLYGLINTLNSVVDKMLKSNNSVKVLSLVLALILLFSVTGGSFDSLLTSPNSGDYINNVPLKVQGLQNDYEISGLPKSVDVGLVGSSLDIYSTKLQKDYEIYVDVSGLGEGDHTVELKTRDFPKDLKVFLTPQTVTINITKKVTKTFKLDYEFINNSAMDSKYSVGVNNINHKEVEVSGSQENIDKINSVKALIDLTNVDDSFQQDCDIVAYDRSGKKVTVDIIPKTAKVDCTVSTYSKTVDVIAKYTNKCAAGYGVESYSFNKSKVKIYGEKSQLANINSVEAEVDIKNLSSDVMVTNCKLTKPSGVNKLSFDSVDCDVKIKPTITKVFNGLNIEANNNTKDYTITINDTANVQIEGVDSVVNKLTNEDITVYVDVKNQKVGRRELQVKVKTKNTSLNATLLTDQKVSVSIRR